MEHEGPIQSIRLTAELVHILTSIPQLVWWAKFFCGLTVINTVLILARWRNGNA